MTYTPHIHTVKKPILHPFAALIIRKTVYDGYLSLDILERIIICGWRELPFPDEPVFSTPNQEHTTPALPTGKQQQKKKKHALPYG